MNFERGKDPKEILDIGVFGIDRQFETYRKAALWFFNNYTRLFPEGDFKSYAGKLSLPIDIFNRITNYINDHIEITNEPRTPFDGEDNVKQKLIQIPNMLEDIAQEIYVRCINSPVPRPFPIPVDIRA